MSIIVEHEKRREEILRKALEVFVVEGYDDATYQKIADRCGVQRTTLYLYFKNKQDIFKNVVKQLTETIETDFTPFMEDRSISPSERLKAVMDSIMDAFARHRKLLAVTLEYLIRIGRAEGDPADRVRRRTIRLKRHILHLVLEGVKSGEFRPVDAHAASDTLYAILESSIMRLTVLNDEAASSSIKTAVDFIEALKA
jgi:AcrR family transcriptional regulator